MGGDEVEVSLRRVGEGAGVVGVQACDGIGNCAAARLGGGAAWRRWCRRRRLEGGDWQKESGEEAAVAVAEDEGAFAVEEAREEVGSAALERAAEGEVFGEAIGAGDGVEVAGWATVVRSHRRKGRNASGVRRARSAAARRVCSESDGDGGCGGARAAVRRIGRRRRRSAGVRRNRRGRRLRRWLRWDREQ